MNRILLSFSCLLSVSAVIQAQSEFCGDGTLWDDASQTCVIDSTQFSCLTQPIDNSCYFDVSGNGVVGPEDLLSFLASFASTCEANLPPWACGDPLEYQGYDYATVLIGEQCWFAENLRAENYENGDPIPAGLTDSEWGNTGEGAVSFYGADGFVSYGSSDAESNVSLYGMLYNGFAVQDSRGLCPASWSVPTDIEWTDLEFHLGMDSVEVYGTTYRGNKGPLIKNGIDDIPSWNGTNETMWSGAPGGGRAQIEGFYFEESLVGYYWGQEQDWNGGLIPYRALGAGDGIFRAWRHPSAGFSVRCIKD